MDQSRFNELYMKHGCPDAVFRNCAHELAPGQSRRLIRKWAKEFREDPKLLRQLKDARAENRGTISLEALAEKLPSLYEEHRSLRGVARAIGEHRETVRKAYRRAVDLGLMNRLALGGKPGDYLARKTPTAPAGPVGRVRAPAVKTYDLPEQGQIKRYLFTAAQNDTEVFEAFWRNLNALADHYGAEIKVARFTYHKRGLGARGDKAAVVKADRTLFKDDMDWEPRLQPYFEDERVKVAPGLDWCGEMNILPTAVRPLSGLNTYTGRRSSIFPHVKVAMESVASNKAEATKFLYTTGTVTKRNYIHRKAGLKAEENHTYGALLVEVEGDGSWFSRQIIGDRNGVIHDLDLRVRAGKVTDGNRVEAVYWGDPHVVEADEGALELAFGKGMMKDQLRPRQEFMGDVLSFRGRSHHDMKDPFRMFLHHKSGIERVATEVDRVAAFLELIQRPWCQTRIVYGNHERHLGRWLKEQDGRLDPINAEFWSALQAEQYRHMAETLSEANYLELALRTQGHEVYKELDFIAEDESRVVLHNKNGGIECGMHGDTGPKGARGTPSNLAKTGRKLIIGDKHSAEIIDGCWVAGTFSKQDVGWNKGPSNWSHSHVIIHANGCRQMVTMWAGRFAAGRGLTKV